MSSGAITYAARQMDIMQTEYVTRLAKMVKGEAYDTAPVSMSVYSLNRIDGLLGDKRNSNVETQAHVQKLKLIIERALSADA